MVTMHEAQDMGTLRMAGARKTTRHFFGRYREQYESDTQLAGIEPTVFTIGTGMEIGRQPHRPTPGRVDGEGLANHHRNANFLRHPNPATAQPQ
ncbi:MAG: hypothetical protein ACI9OD_005349 [Limisphaerales bacterium]|jgi:hypothetical protein